MVNEQYTRSNWNGSRGQKYIHRVQSWTGLKNSAPYVFFENTFLRTDGVNAGGKSNNSRTQLSSEY